MSRAFSFNLNQYDAADYDNNNDDQNDVVLEERHHQNNNNNQHELEEMKEAMFEKPLTPSDVGKLNRLVIPKQHAEKYFPLSGGGDSGSGGEKGLLLSFEDESGKFWRFRYSYWNSSQSYVLTKGWSRYVKEKRLDAGDVVLFERHRRDNDRLFIGWRRRPAQDSAAVAAAHVSNGGGGESCNNNNNNLNNSTTAGWTRMFYSAHPYPAHPHYHHHLHHPAMPYQPDSIHAGIFHFFLGFFFSTFPPYL